MMLETLILQFRRWRWTGSLACKLKMPSTMFQHLFDLKVDGIVGEKTWNRLLQVKSYLMRQE